MKNLRHACILIFALCSISEAGLIAPGRHSGVVIFDRWGGCILLKGQFVLYVSERIKRRLQPFAGQCADVEVTNLRQAAFGGDALITAFKSVVVTPEFKPQNYGRPIMAVHADGEVEHGPYWLKTEGLHLTSAVRIQPDGRPVACLIIENTNSMPIRLRSYDLALTLLRKGRNDGTGSDGPSFALVTHIGLGSGKLEGSGVGRPCAWTLNAETPLPAESFNLGPGEKREFKVGLDLRDGQYELVFAYGGQAHQIPVIASNQSGFDVDKGKAIAVGILKR